MILQWSPSKKETSSSNQNSSACSPNYHISSKSRCTSKSCRPRNVAASICQLVPINAALEISPHGKGSTAISVCTHTLRAYNGCCVCACVLISVDAALELLPHQTEPWNKILLWRDFEEIRYLWNHSSYELQPWHQYSSIIQLHLPEIPSPTHFRCRRQFEKCQKSCFVWSGPFSHIPPYKVVVAKLLRTERWGLPYSGKFSLVQTFAYLAKKPTE